MSNSEVRDILNFPRARQKEYLLTWSIKIYYQLRQPAVFFLN